jgi:hypothetical protein
VMKLLLIRAICLESMCLKLQKNRDLTITLRKLSRTSDAKSKTRSSFDSKVIIDNCCSVVLVRARTTMSMNNGVPLMCVIVPAFL